MKDKQTEKLCSLRKKNNNITYIYLVFTFKFYLNSIRKQLKKHSQNKTKKDTFTICVVRRHIEHTNTTHFLLKFQTDCILVTYILRLAKLNTVRTITLFFVPFARQTRLNFKLLCSSPQMIFF